MHRKFVHGDPGLGIHLRVGNGPRQFHAVMVHSMEAPLHVQLVTDRATGTIQPDSVFRHHSDRLDSESAVILPFANRVPIKTWFSNFTPHEHSSIHQFWELPPVSPDHP